MLVRVERLLVDEVVRAVPEHQQACLGLSLHGRGLVGEEHDVHAGMLHLLVKGGPRERAHLMPERAARAADRVSVNVSQQPALPF